MSTWSSSIEPSVAGFSPSVRLFAAPACGTPVISDYWQGIDSFFKISNEILITDSTDQTLGYIMNISEDKRKQIGQAARNRILNEHTALKRAKELEQTIYEVVKRANE